MTEGNSRSASWSAAALALLVVLVLVVVLFVVLDGFEFDGRDAGHFEIRAAVGATNQVALVDVELVDLDLRITFRTGGHHALLDNLRIISQNLINSATSRTRRTLATD